MEHDNVIKKKQTNDIEPYNEIDDVRGSRREEDGLEQCDPLLDPGFSSWSDYYRYMFGYY